MNPAVFSPFLRLASPADPTLEGLGRHLALPTAGILVFNPSPFSQSGPVALPEGGLRVVTDVPGLGYAFEPTGAAGHRGSEAGPSREALRPIETARFSARLDERTGALASLVDRASGRELVAPDGELNGREGAVLSDGWVDPLDGVGVRLVARRMGKSGPLTSRVTLYHELPWADVENAADSGTRPDEETRFDLSLAPEEVRREVAGGAVRVIPPVERVTMLRWLALRAAGETVLFGAGAPATVTATAAGRLTVHGAGANERFRLALHRGLVLPDEPWRFGFGMTPLIAVPAPGSGSLRLPTFGRLLDVADPSVAVVGIKDADDGIGLMAYLMDLAGLPRGVTVRPGVLTFDAAAETDLTERDRGPLDPAPSGGVLVPLDASGYAAFRLLGARVAG
jgi:hypothetical protein